MTGNPVHVKPVHNETPKILCTVNTKHQSSKLHPSITDLHFSLLHINNTKPAAQFTALSLRVSAAYCTVLKCWAKRPSIKLACWLMNWLGQKFFRASHFLIEKILHSGVHSVLKYTFNVIYKNNKGLIYHNFIFNNLTANVWFYLTAWELPFMIIW